MHQKTHKSKEINLPKDGGVDLQDQEEPKKEDDEFEAKIGSQQNQNQNSVSLHQ